MSAASTARRGFSGVGAHEFDFAALECRVLPLGDDEDARSFGDSIAGFHSGEFDAALAEVGDDPVIDLEILGGDDDHCLRVRSRPN